MWVVGRKKKMTEQSRRRTRLLSCCVAVLAAAAFGGPVIADDGIDSHDMQWIGHADLQGRVAYEPTVIQQGNKFILYVGHHQGDMLNPLTGHTEANGTSIVDVTNPRRPVQLFHLPGVTGQDNS